MAATMFFPPPSILAANPDHLPIDDDDEIILRDDVGAAQYHLHLTNCAGDAQSNNIHCHEDQNVPPVVTSSSSAILEEVDEEVEEEEEDVEEDSDEEVEEVDDDREESHQQCHIESNAVNVPTGNGVGTLIGRRVTLKPRRTLSLSPTPVRAGDMMSRNLRAARWLDFTNEDDDDGLYQPSDSDSEGKIKTFKEECFGRVRVPTRRGGSLGSLTVGAMTGLGREVFGSRRGSSSMKRPLEVSLPCQEIQYLDISYQKVGIHSVQFSPIPRKKIAYHPVPYHAIHYCNVPFLGERPVKRKPPA